MASRMSELTSKYHTETRKAQPYISLISTLPMTQIPTLAQKIPLLYQHLASTSTPPTGAPFFRYIEIPLAMEPSEAFVVEVGIPVSSDYSKATDQGDIKFSHLPAGKYLETTHVGAPMTLRNATKNLLEHARDNRLEFDVKTGGAGERDVWVSRLEIYESDPKTVEMGEWRTRLSFKLK
jgi:effector-binding domain-containing protein